MISILTISKPVTADCNRCQTMARNQSSTITKKEFEQLFDQYFDDIASFLYMYASGHDELNDWIQEVFIRLWEKREKIDFYHPSFKSYLLKTARNHALRKLQQKKSYNNWLEENLIRLTELHKAGQTEQAPFSPVFKTAYQKALSKIPSRALETWRLSREDGLTYPEIAKVMGVSVKTVETQISTALRILREEFGNMRP